MVIGAPGANEKKQLEEKKAKEAAGGKEEEEEGAFMALGGDGKSADKTTKDGRKKDELYVEVRLKSGEVRRIHRDACATIGTASNSNNNRRQLGKAGRSRWLGIRPTVRGVAMNASDHPHGGGRGKSKGNVQPVSIWGTPAKGGYKTRGKRNVNRFLVTERPRNQNQKSKPGKKDTKGKKKK
ncbi:MAG: hypothetical protein Q9183_007926 [Haloplaca sp. 2 TL-2023]